MKIFKMMPAWLILLVSTLPGVQASGAGQQDNSDAAEVCSIFEAVEANCRAWRQGDVLFTTRRVYDTSAVIDGQILGQLEGVESVTRVVFDYDAGLFFFAKLSFTDVERFDDESPTAIKKTVLSSWICTGKSGQVARYNPGKKRTLWNRDQFPADQTVLLTMIQQPDLRGFWLHRKPTLHGRSLGSTTLASGKGFRSASESADELKIVFNVEESNPVPGTIPQSSIAFDLESLMPTRFRRFTSRTDGVVAQGPSFDIQWQQINGLQVLASASARRYRGIPGRERKEHGPEYTDYRFHWFSVNQPIDPEHFQIELVDQRELLLEMLDPVKLKADSLMPNSVKE